MVFHMLFEWPPRSDSGVLLSEEKSDKEVAHPEENVVPEGVCVGGVDEDQIEDIGELKADVVKDVLHEGLTKVGICGVRVLCGCLEKNGELSWEYSFATIDDEIISLL